MAFRYIAAGSHPDHDTLASFRNKNPDLFIETVLVMRAKARAHGVRAAVLLVVRVQDDEFINETPAKAGQGVVVGVAARSYATAHARSVARALFAAADWVDTNRNT